MALVIKMHPHKFKTILRNDPRYEAYSQRIAHKIRIAAIGVFSASQRWDNEFRTSEFTPPKYISSFRVEWHNFTATSRVINDDPGWYLVEYGAHAGGKTRVLRYRPLGRALDIVAGGG